jgi:hypothetical protein
MTLDSRISDFQPVSVRDATPGEMAGELAPLPTGQEIFDSKSKAEQDEMLGPEAAERVRSGEAQLADLVAESPQATADDFITQAPTGA